MQDLIDLDKGIKPPGKFQERCSCFFVRLIYYPAVIALIGSAICSTLAGKWHLGLLWALFAYIGFMSVRFLIRCECKDE